MQPIEFPLYNLESEFIPVFEPQVYTNPDLNSGCGVTDLEGFIGGKWQSDGNLYSRYCFAKQKIKHNAEHELLVNGRLLAVLNEQQIILTEQNSLILADLTGENTDRKLTFDCEKEEVVTGFTFLCSEKIIGLAGTVIMDGEVARRYLKICDFLPETPVITAEIEIDLDAKYVLSGQTVFVHYKSDLCVYDLNLQPVNHPLTDVWNQYSGNVQALAVNGKHSFAVCAVADSKNKESTLLRLIMWGSKPEDWLEVLLLDSCRIDHLAFSPDGEWLLLSNCNRKDQSKQLYLLPVEKRLSYHLAQPVKINNCCMDHKNLFWSDNSRQLVKINEYQVLRWNIESLNKRLFSRYSRAGY